MSKFGCKIGIYNYICNILINTPSFYACMISSSLEGYCAGLGEEKLVDDCFNNLVSVPVYACGLYRFL